MAKYEIQGATLEGIANAIREKTGSTDKIVPEAMANEISAITAGVDTSDATAAAINIESGYSAYVNGEKVEGSLTLADMVPEMENPATADEIISGYQAVGADGNIIEGTSNAVELPALTNPASAAEIIAGYEAIDGVGGLITGTASKGAVVETGTFTGNNSSSITISGLTSKKSNILLTLDTTSTYRLSKMNVISASCINNERTAVYITSHSSSEVQINFGKAYLTSVTFNANSITLNLNTSLKFTAATFTYRWIAW